LDLLASCLQVLLSTLKYSAIADLYSLQFTVAHVLGFSAFTSLETEKLEAMALEPEKKLANFKNTQEPHFIEIFSVHFSV
jgi:hypothetical protein